MSEGDTTAQPLHDLMSAFGLLTRLPLPQTTRHRADAAWCWPIIGVVVSGLAAGIGFGLHGLGVTTAASAAALIGSLVILTGALHEDGLADTADGLYGGWTPERRLEIMKDSRIGTYGTLALIVVFLVNWSSLDRLIATADWAAIMAAAALSRATMAVVMWGLPNARKSGLSASVGKPRTWSAGTAACLSLVAAGTLTGDLTQSFLMAGGAALAAFGVAIIAKRRIGGQTGDVLGAAQQLSFAAALIGAQM